MILRSRPVPSVPRHRLAVSLAAAALLALSPHSAESASHRLSEGLPFSDVYSPALSPDGRFVVYLHDAVVDGAYEIWSVPVAGGTPTRLSGLLPSGVAPDEVAISPDSQAVVYIAQQETAGMPELFSAPIAGPEDSWTKLNPPLVDGGGVPFFGIAPGSDRVAFVADVQTDQVFDVWSVPLAGGPALRLRPGVTQVGSTVYLSPEPRISPTGERVIFLANFSDLAKWQLWSARLDGTGGVVRINGTLVAGGNVTQFAISPDGSQAVYIADQAVDGRLDLYSVPVEGGTATRLSPAAVPSGGNVACDFAISPDGTRVVYRADHTVDNRIELYSVPITGGTPVKLNGALTTGGTVEATFAISPDDSRVVYRADQQTDDQIEIYSVPLAGGTAVKLNGAMVSGGDVERFKISPDSSRVVYKADQQTNNVQELYSVALTGGPAVRVNDPLPPGGTTSLLGITPDSAFVFYIASSDGGLEFEIFRGSILGGPEADVRLNGPLPPGGSIDTLSILIHRDSRQVIYVASQEVDGRRHLYVGDPCILCDGFEAGDLRRWP